MALNNYSSSIFLRWLQTRPFSFEDNRALKKSGECTWRVSWPIDRATCSRKTFLRTNKFTGTHTLASRKYDVVVGRREEVIFRLRNLRISSRSRACTPLDVLNWAVMTVCLRSLFFSHEDAEILLCVLELLLVPLLLRSSCVVLFRSGSRYPGRKRRNESPVIFNLSR